MKYQVCPQCGAHLDHGERCGCEDKKEAAPMQRERPHANETTASVTAPRGKVKARAAFG